MRRFLSLVIALTLLLATTAAQTPSTLDKTLLSGLKWRSIGPTSVGGRIDDFAVGRTPGKPDAMYVASASGGIFKSVNGGVSWTPIFDNVDAMMSMGDIAVASSNPDIVWAGTGEANNRQSSSWGDGVYKSTDAGKTWKNMGLKETRSVGRIVIDPKNADIVYVAAAGHLWGSNPDRGVFKTADGGATWKKTLFVDDNTGATDILIDPRNPQVLYAATYQHQRKSWGYNGGGPGSGVYKSTDSGEHWTKLTKGLPAGDMGRIGLDMFSIGKDQIVYAIVEASTGGGGRGGAGGAGRGAAPTAAAPVAPDNAGLYRSIDAGATWEHLSAQDTRPSYYSQIRVDPKDKNRLYELGSNRGFYVSDDGGKTFVDIFAGAPGQSLIHGEDHAMWVDPDDPNHLMIGGDGGVSISWDRGLSWEFKNNIPVGQFYEIDVDNKIPYTVCGGLQDNGEWCVPSAVRDRNGIANRDSWNIGGGDGFYVKFDRTDENYAYAESQEGGMGRVNLTTLQRQNVKPAGTFRWNWDTPIIVSAHDPNVIYTGANVLFRSPDRGTTWTPISPDLTSGIDPATLEIMGARVTPATLSRDDGTSAFGSLTTIGESPIDKNVLYTGAEDGTVQVTKDGGKTWTNLTAKIPELPKYTYVSTVLPSKNSAGTVYATFDWHNTDDYKTNFYIITDYGQTSRWLAAGLPETTINRIREHPSDPHFLVLAHEKGVHVSNDGGATWIPLSLTTNLPNVPTDDAIIHPRDNALIVGTHGRGIWILDDVGPLQLLTSQTLASDAALAPIAPAHEIITHAVQAWYGANEFFAPNPSFDASFSYYLRAAATSGTATITIADSTGATVRTMTGPLAKGINHVAWDLHANPPSPVAAADAPAGAAGAGGRQGGGGRGRGGNPQGPLVAPGKYQVTIAIPGVAQPLRGSITVDRDPLGR